jgi:hypothetical protein
MRKFLFIPAALLIAGSAMAAGANLVRSHGPRSLTPSPALDIAAVKARLTAIYGVSALTTGNTYVGSEVCLGCHNGHLASDKSSWRDTKHNQALRKPMVEYTLIAGKGVVADYDQNHLDDFQQGLDFNAISSKFDKYKPNAPKLSFAGGTYFVTIGTLTMPVMFTQGGTGDWKQRYGLHVPVTDLPGGLSADIYMSPVQYNDKTHGYVAYNPGNWYDAANQPKYTAGMTSSQIAANTGASYSKNCIGCHATGVRKMRQTATGEWLYSGWVALLEQEPSTFDYDGDGNNDLVNVGCEACHGPGGNHLMAGGDPAKIVNPAKLDYQAANEICGHCHIRVVSVPNGTHEWPVKDDTETEWVPGSTEPLKNFYEDEPGLWPDGKTSLKHHQQFQDLYRSPKPTFAYHHVKCIDCHDSHGSEREHMVVESTVQEGVEITTDVDNNTLCLACHAKYGPFASLTKDDIAHYGDNVPEIGAVVSAHAYHPYGPERSMGLGRCTKCHMATTATSGVAYDIHSHTFEAIPPTKTLTFQAQGGMPSACAVSCHATKVNSFGLGLDPDIAVWNAQFDKDTATALQKYYGPEGLWWQTEAAPPVPLRWMPSSNDDEDNDS